jgi:small ligand-binding sensory domain FIST
VDRTRLASRIGAGLSTNADPRAAAAAAAAEAASGVDGEVDLAFVFVSGDVVDGMADAVEEVREALLPAHLVGCAAEGVVARHREVEEGPAVAVWAAAVPGVELEPFHTVALEVDEGVVVSGFPDAPTADLVALFADPYSFPVGSFLARLNEERPGLPLVGGLATGRGDGIRRALVVDDEVYDEGAVGVAMAGAPVVAVVSQGCAPIGREAVITAAEGNVVYELAGLPAVERLRAELASLSPADRALAARGILAGLVIDENRADYGRGDYLMRAIIGADEDAGSLAVGEQVRVGQTLRFHVRDARSADEDLREALGAFEGVESEGALLFTCNGRGRSMFTRPDHDAALISEALCQRPLAGFFAGGEIGPVGGRTFLHGFTATLAVFLRLD